MSEIIYNWNFNPLEITYNEDGLTDVIDLVHWQYSATYQIDGTNSITKQNIGTIGLPSPSPASFTPFVDVTKEMVVEWVTTAMGTERIESMQQSLSSSIAYDLSPTKGTVSPPWSL